MWHSRRQSEWIVFIGIGLLHLGYVFFVSTPLIHADEAGHLLNGAALAGFSTYGPTSYGVGFPVLFSPLFLIFDEPETIFRFVLIANAALATLTAWLVYRFIAVWQQGEQHWQVTLAVSSAAAFYPASFAYTTSAQAEVLFSAVFTGIMLANFRLAASNGKDRWPLVISAALTGAVVFVHLRGTPTAILSALFVLFILAHARRFVALAAWFAISACVLSVGWSLARVIQCRLKLESCSGISDFSGHGYNVGSRFQVFSSQEEFWTAFGRLMMTGAGQLSYAVAATLGLSVIGVWAMVRRARIGPQGPAQAFCIFGVAVLAANLGMSAVFLYQGNRVDHIIYGRYNEALLPVFLAFGLLEINRTNARAAFLAFAASLVVLLLTLAALPGPEFLPANLHNVMGLYWLMKPFTGGQNILLLKAGCIAAIIVLLAFRRRWGVLVISGFFAMQSLYLAIDFLMPSSDGRMSQRRIAEYIQDNVDPGTCVTQHLTPGISAWSHWNTKFFLFDYQMREDTDIVPDQICSPWVISADPGFQINHPNAIMVHQEHSHSQRLWYMGRITDALRFPNELPVGAHIEFAGDARGVDFLGPGWGAQERWGVRMVGPRSSIDFRIPTGTEGECRFRLRGEWFLNERRARGRVEVRIGAGSIQTFEQSFPNKRFEWLLSIHSDQAEGRRISIEINAEDPQSMQQLGLGDDTRRPSIGLTDLIFDGCES